MAACEEYTRLISAALDGELSPREQAELDAHLARCPQCREVMDQLSGLRQTLAQLPPVPPPPQLKDDIMAAVAQHPVPRRGSRWAKGLACAAVAAVVITAAWRFGVPTPMVGSDSSYDESTAITAETAEDDAVPDRGGSAEAGGVQDGEKLITRMTAGDAAIAGGASNSRNDAAPEAAPKAAAEEAADQPAQKSTAEVFDTAAETPYATQADRDAAPISVPPSPSGAPVQALLEVGDNDPYALSPDAEAVVPDSDRPLLPPS